MTAEQLALDCEPDWHTGPPDLRDTRPPGAAHARHTEISDLDGQHAGRHALRTATTIDTGSYL